MISNELASELGKVVKENIGHYKKAMIDYLDYLGYTHSNNFYYTSGSYTLNFYVDGEEYTIICSRWRSMGEVDFKLEIDLITPDPNSKVVEIYKEP